MPHNTKLKSDLEVEAQNFSWERHAGQVRKYTGEPYFFHCCRVAQLVREQGGSPEAIAASYLHDTIEDTDTTYEELISIFGVVVADMVLDLSDVSKPSDGNRATRKKLDRAAYILASPVVKTIKLADMIDNSLCILKHDKKFAEIYLPEKALLLNYLVGGSEELFKRAQDILRRGLKELNIDSVHISK